VLFSTHQMEQAEKVCDNICIITRGKKVLDGKLRELKRASAAEGLVALGFPDDAARAKAEPVLGDRTLVAETRPPRPGDATADHEVKLADGADSSKLLAALVAAGAAVRRFEVVVPTLHQIFVERVGAEAAVAERRPEEAA
jgi:ABC-2 type transport system ATP-binding protein